MGQDNKPTARIVRTGSNWKWWICGLLFLATTLNYMDRQALAQTAVSIKKDFHLTPKPWGDLIAVFNLGFGIGAISIGWVADKGNLRWIYAMLVLGWSMVSFATGYVESFAGLVVCRLLLGIFEAGNWPCGILTISRILKPEERSLGNGIFQGGTAAGAILIPLVVVQIVDPAESRAWQIPFRIIGVVGMAWVAGWLLFVRSSAIAAAPATAAVTKKIESYWAIWCDRRFYLIALVVVSVNTPWRTFNEWLTQFLQDGKGYSDTIVQYYSIAYFSAAGLGSLLSGLLALRLVRGGRSLFGSRMITFAVCAGLSTTTLLIVRLPPGPLLFTCILLIGFGNLGSFTTYFSLSQEISARHQAKLTGTLGIITAVSMAGLGEFQGWLIGRIGFESALGLTGLVPMIAVLAVWLFWNRESKAKQQAVTPGDLH